jgi:hypothetical protein
MPHDCDVRTLTANGHAGRENIMKVLGCWVEKPREKEGLYNAANIRYCLFDFMLILLLFFLSRN